MRYAIRIANAILSHLVDLYTVEKGVSHAYLGINDKGVYAQLISGWKDLNSILVAEALWLRREYPGRKWYNVKIVC